jgi:methionine-rich copper-binding protein CopC
MKKKAWHRDGLRPVLSLLVVALAAGGCGELTGPKSPSTPSNVVATLVTPTSALITWTPSPLNDGVISYNIFRDGTRVGQSTTTNFTDVGLPQQVTIKYTVSANCTAGVISDQSPETPEATVTTVDVTPPTVIATNPANGAVGVSRAGTSTVTFSEPMDPSTIDTTSFNLKVTATGQLIPGTVVYTAATRIAEFFPTGALPNATNVTATVTTGVKDLAGNALANVGIATWTTRDEVGPTVTATTPANGAVGVSPSTTVTVTFSEPADASTITASSFTLRETSSGTPVTGTVTYDAATRVATFMPSSPLAQRTGYTATVAGSVRDAAGNQMGADFQFSFTTSDITAPTVTSTVPADLATNVSPGVVVSATFSEAMDPATINGTTFTLRATVSGTAVTGTVAYNAGTNTATFTPSAPLPGGTNYTATITTGATDQAGNPLAANKTWTFTTADTTPPTVITVNPANNSTNVATNATVSVTFSEPMNAAMITTATFNLRNTATSALVAGAVSYNPASNVATFTPGGPLADGTNYTVTVTTGVQDASGNALASDFTSNFATAPAADVTPPTVVARTPANVATNVGVNTDITVTFSEPMDATTINSTNITLTPTAGGPAVTTAVTCNSPCTTATLDPTADLASSTSYTITVTTGVKDVAGNALATNSTSTFTTADVIPPTVVSRTPSDAATSVPLSTNVTVTFSEPMDATTINSTSITVTPAGGGPAVAAAVTCNSPCTTATLDPAADLASSTSYTITVTSEVKDVAGNSLAAHSTSTFTTADVIPPTVGSRTPSDGETNVAVNTNITVTFNEPMDVATINSTNITLTPTAGGAAVAATVTCNTPCTIATLDPTADLPSGMSGTSYTITVTTGVKDLAGNALAANSTSAFTTIPDTTSPIVIATSPASGSTVPAPGTVTVTFNEAMNPATISGTTFVVTVTIGGAVVPGTVSYNTSTNIATFTPDSPGLIPNGYTATVTTGAQDLAGNGITATFIFTFTTT